MEGLSKGSTTSGPSLFRGALSPLGPLIFNARAKKSTILRPKLRSFSSKIVFKDKQTDMHFLEPVKMHHATHGVMETSVGAQVDMNLIMA